MKRLGSNLATPTGLVVLSLLVLTAAYLKIKALLGLLTAVLLLCGAAYIWARTSLKKVSIRLDGEECCAFPGEEMRVSAELKNSKLMPLTWLEAGFIGKGKQCVESAEELRPAQEENTGGNRESGEASAPILDAAFLWVMPYQTIGWTQTAKAIRRGVCRIEAIELMSGDGFALADSSRRIPMETAFRFIVFPRLLAADVGPIVRKMREMEDFERGMYVDRTLIRNIRDYLPGDSFRDVNWRALARQGKLLTNIHEHMDMRKVCIAVDLESFSYTEVTEFAGERHTQRKVNEDELEHVLSAAATVIAQLDERGVMCSLALPAYGDVQAETVVPQQKERQMTELLTALAQVDYSGEKARFPVQELLEIRHDIGQLFIMRKGGNTSSAAMRQLEDLMPVSICFGADSSGIEESNIINETDIILQ